MARRTDGGVRFRPVGSSRHPRTPVRYSPGGTGCPAIEQAIEQLYHGQNEESFWALMGPWKMRAGAGDPCSGAAADGPGHTAHPGPLGREPRPAAKGQRACALDPEKQGPYLAAAVHLQRSCLRGPQHGGPPHGGLHPAGRHGTGAGCAGHRRRGHRPVGPPATLDEALLNGLLHAGHNPEEPGDEEVEAGREAARAGDWRMAADHYDEAAQQGNAMGLSLLADCLYRGRGEMQNKTEARRMWRTAADHGEVLAMLSLGEDCAARGEAGKALLYYRKPADGAGHAGHEYTLRICLRLAQAETCHVSAKKAMALAAEAAQGFAILAREKEPDAAELQAEAEQLLRELADPKPRNTAYNIDSLQLD